MKKFIALFACLMLVTYGFAQDSTKVNNNVIYIDIPKKLNIKDKIILVNKSPYTVLQSMVVIAGDKNVLGSTTFVGPGSRADMASYDNNWLKNLRGKRIALKVKAVKKVIADVSTTGVSGGSWATGSFGVGVNHTEIKADELNNIDPKLITYDFKAQVYECDHDLYIEVINSTNNSDNPLDF